MITILYIYKNKDLQRVKNSLDSLVNQTNKAFEIVFVDYGSGYYYKNALSEVLAEYDNIRLIYTYTVYQPWSRPKAINIGLKYTFTEYLFVADIDMIFRNDFIDVLHKIKQPDKTFFFKVGFLSEEESKKNLSFEEYNISFESKSGAQGLSLFPLKALKDLNGLSEFIHFWGADNDIHNRLKNAGLDTVFYEDEILMLHQWHLIYRKTLKMTLTKEIQLSGILRINMQHQSNNIKNKITKVNHNSWGIVIEKEQFDKLENAPISIELPNVKSIVDYFVYYELPSFKSGILSVRFYEDDFEKTIKYKIKKVLGKTVPEYYSLKEVNDKLLLHIVSFYKHFPYTYKVADDLRSIIFSILK